MHSDDPKENEIHDRFHKLMDQVDFQNKKTGPYKEEIHRFLKEKYMYGIGHVKSNIFPPLEKDKINERLPELMQYYAGGDQKWPRSTFRDYSMDYMTDKSPGMLYFGYALSDGKLYPCAFFVVFTMTWVIPECPGELFPEEKVIDPIALGCGIEPECYIGRMVISTDIEPWLLEETKINPLEALYIRYQQERSDDKDWQNEILMAPHRALQGLEGENKELAIKWYLKA